MTRTYFNEKLPLTVRKVTFSNGDGTITWLNPAHYPAQSKGTYRHNMDFQYNEEKRGKNKGSYCRILG